MVITTSSGTQHTERAFLTRKSRRDSVMSARSPTVKHAVEMLPTDKFRDRDLNQSRDLRKTQNCKILEMPTERIIAGNL